MPMLIKFVCDVCGAEYVEERYGAGAPGWGELKGVKLNGVDNPLLCPEHLAQTAYHLDQTVKELKP